MISGTILIDKQIGLTSRQEVNNVSRILGERKAGHIGTLDPFADGLLIVLLGRATKISPFLETMDKTYIATLKLGEKTDTGDFTGAVVERKNVPQLTRSKINDVLSSFLGKQSQIPPMYSALKIDGKELYKYAREGKEIERKSREITIFSIDLLSFDNDTITFKTHVSKGTYIRTLGEDIAEKLGTVGTLTKLTRTTIGPYSLQDAVKSENAIIDNLKSTKEMLSYMDKIVLSGDIAKKALNGVKLKIDSTSNLLLIEDKEDVIAVYQKTQTGIYSCLRGLR